jgi:hypothetical protein
VSCTTFLLLRFLVFHCCNPCNFDLIHPSSLQLSAQDRRSPKTSFCFR